MPPFPSHLHTFFTIAFPLGLSFPHLRLLPTRPGMNWGIWKFFLLVMELLVVWWRLRQVRIATLAFWKTPRRLGLPPPLPYLRSPISCPNHQPGWVIVF